MLAFQFSVMILRSYVRKRGMRESENTKEDQGHMNTPDWGLVLNDASFTSCFVVDALTIETTIMHGTFFALVVAPIPTDSTQWSCWLSGGSSGSVKISRYRGGNVR
jgi:hypothetical protein